MQDIQPDPDEPIVADAALDAVYRTIAPEVRLRERALRAADPSLADAEVLDRALRQALAHFRFEAAQQTVAYLKWRTAQTRAAAAKTIAEASATLAATAAARRARAEARAASLAVPFEQTLEREEAGPRRYTDLTGCPWSVYEVEARDTPGAKRDHCLLFCSEGVVRRVWHYPAEWRSLKDAELDALSWHV